MATTSKKRTKSKRTTPTEASPTNLWLACFSFDRPPTKWNGTCQMVVEGTDPNDAMRRCHEKFVKLADTTDLFEPGTKVYTFGLIRLTGGSFSEAVLVNWDTTNGPGCIYNLSPDPDDGGAEAISITMPPPLKRDDPFIEFFAEGTTIPASV